MARKSVTTWNVIDSVFSSPIPVWSSFPKAPSASADSCSRPAVSNAFDHRDAPGGTYPDWNNDPDNDIASDLGIPEFPRARDERRSQPLELDARSKVVFWLFRAMLNALSLIPDFLLYPIGIAGGFIGYLLDRRHVRIGLKNLEIAFPEKSEVERRQILRASYLNLGRAAAEYVRLGGFFYRRLRRRVSYKGLSNFAQ